MILEEQVGVSGALARVLIVASDPSVQSALAHALAGDPYELRFVSQGSDALSVLADGSPDVILLDQMMPHMNGFEMLRTMRENPAWHDVPVVIVTSKDLGRDELDWLRGNTLEVFQKGAYGRAELVAALRDMVEAARRKRVPADA